MSSRYWQHYNWLDVANMLHGRMGISVECAKVDVRHMFFLSQRSSVFQHQVCDRLS